MKPSLFIASSSEQHAVMRELERQLCNDVALSPWTDIFQLTQSYLSSLYQTAMAMDFAVVVFAPDDLTKLRGETFATVRDNVIFELGLFLGRLGPDRCAIVAPKNAGPDELKLHLPSDLSGIKLADYDPSLPLEQALRKPCAEIRALIRKSQQLSSRVLDDWLEIKDKPEHPFALVTFDRKPNGDLKVSGTSYDRDGKQHYTWPKDIDFATPTRTGIVHCYDGFVHNGTDFHLAHGISIYNFDTEADHDPVRGSGYYVDRSERSGGYATSRVNFKLIRLTQEYVKFILGDVRLLSHDHRGDLMRAIARHFRPQRIVLTGGPGSGKTAVIERLGELKHTIVAEAAAQVMKRKVTELGDATLFPKWKAANARAFQDEVFKLQTELEHAMLSLGCAQAFFDRSGVDGIAYLERSELEAPAQLVTYAREMHFKVVFVFDTLPEAIFNKRPETGRDSDWSESVHMGNRLERIYQSFGHRTVRVPSNVSVEERVQFILSQIGTDAG